MPTSGPLSPGFASPDPDAAPRGSLLKRALLIGVPALVLAGLVGARLVAVRAKAADLTKGASARRNAAPAVEVASAGPRTLQAVLTVVGDAQSPTAARLAPKVAGPITFLEAREGDEVRAGQVLVRIDPREVEAGVSAAKAAVAEARARLAGAQATASATLVGIEGTIVGGRAGVLSAQAGLNGVRQNRAAQIAAAQASVADLASRISAANADVRSAEANATAAEANLNNARIRYDRVAELYRGGYIAAQDVDDARAQVRVQEGALAVARAAVAARRDTARALASQRKAAEAQVAIVRRTSSATIATADAALRSARATLGTASANRAQGAAYRENLAALRAAVGAAESAEAQAEARRADTALRSPIDGTVTARDADPGSLAAPGTPVVTVQALRPLFIEAAIPLETGGEIRPGTPAKIAFDALPGREVEGRVAGVNRAADVQNRRFTIRVRIENADEAVRPGMFARVTLVTRSTEAAVAVPIEAVNGEGRKASVTVVGERDVAERRPVETGARDGRFVEIRRGLRAGERVVTLAYKAVKDGGKVTIGRPDESGKAGRAAAGDGGRRRGGDSGGGSGGGSGRGSGSDGGTAGAAGGAGPGGRGGTTGARASGDAGAGSGSGRVGGA